IRSFVSAAEGVVEPEERVARRAAPALRVVFTAGLEDVALPDTMQSGDEAVVAVLLDRELGIEGRTASERLLAGEVERVPAEACQTPCSETVRGLGDHILLPR